MPKISNFCRLTSTVTRNPRFAVVTDSDISEFERILGKNNVIREDLDSYNVDWQKWYKGTSKCALLPSSSEEVSAILRHCVRRNLAVVPQAGNTGLVGGSVPMHDEIVINIKRIRNHFEFDDVQGILQCDAGFILQEISDKLSPYGYMMPYSLGAKGSCMVGGNVATCAGGIHLLKYGSLHAHVLGLTAVIPNNDGSIFHLGSSLKKDNTSLHLSHLFLGSEGQLGIVTRVNMTVVKKPEYVFVGILGVDSFENCIELLRFSRAKLGEKLCAFEFMDAEAIDCVETNLSLHNPVKSKSRHYVLMEIEDKDESFVQNFMMSVFDKKIAQDGVLANSVSESEHMWHIRESAPLAVARDGYVYKHDVTLPLKYFYKLTESVRERCGPLAKRIVTYGHLGDGNSHLNLTTEKFSQEMYDRLYPFVYEFVASHGGSISAEHGIGQMKLPYVGLSRSPAEQDLLNKIKAIFDPQGIMNPYKFL